MARFKVNVALATGCMTSIPLLPQENKRLGRHCIAWMCLDVHVDMYRRLFIDTCPYGLDREPTTRAGLEGGTSGRIGGQASTIRIHATLQGIRRKSTSEGW